MIILLLTSILSNGLWININSSAEPIAKELVGPPHMTYYHWQYFDGCNVCQCSEDSCACTLKICKSRPEDWK